MRPARHAGLILAAICCAMSSQTVAAQTTANVARVATPAVVTLRLYGSDGRQIGQGSGFYLPDGRIMTNAHVLTGGVQAEVYDHQGQLLGSVSHAEALALGVDLAILPRFGTPPGTLALAADTPAVGARVVAIGAPRGLTNTVSEGIVSALREFEGRRLIQITAPLSPGSSGGPVLDESGRVIGISVGMLEYGQNLNFAIPARDARALASSPAGRLPFPQQTAAPGVVTERARSHSTSDNVASIRAETPRLHIGATAGRVTQDWSEGDWFAFYHFEARSGEILTLRAHASGFDAYLSVYRVLPDTIILVIEDDDSALGMDAQVTVRVRDSGVYMAAVEVVGEYVDSDAFLLHLSIGTSPAPYGERERWILVRSDEQQTIALDHTTLSRTTGGLLRVWYRRQYRSTEVLHNGTRYDAATELAEINCSRRRVRGIQSVYYLGNRVASSDDLPGDWFDWTPGSVGEYMFTEGCSVAKQLRR
jgi:S1-C subfamily serine protease